MDQTALSDLDDSSRTLLVFAAQFASDGFPSDLLREGVAEVGFSTDLFASTLRALTYAHLLHPAGHGTLLLQPQMAKRIRELVPEEQWEKARTLVVALLVHAAELAANDLQRLAALESNLLVAARLATDLFPTNPKALWPAICLGRLAESRGRLEQAEQWYRSVQGRAGVRSAGAAGSAPQLGASRNETEGDSRHRLEET